MSAIAAEKKVRESSTDPASERDVLAYARHELKRLFAALTDQALTENAKPAAANELSYSLKVDPELKEQEITIRSTAREVSIRGGSATAALHGVYTFFEKIGCVFAFSGQWLAEKRERLTFPELDIRHTPSVRERGIRMHLNFFQDQSYFTEPAFAEFIDDMARQRFNYLSFHLYTPTQWFPFTYRGVKHLGQSLGNRKPLSPSMIGRDRVAPREYWFPADLESVREPEALLAAMYGRFKRMMAHAHARGIRNCVSFEPESLPGAMAAKLPEWTGEDAAALEANRTLAQDWQENWSGVKLAESDVRHPLVIDIAVERCLQCIDSFPDLDELQLISGEGVSWRPKAGQSYEAELDRLTKKFNLPPGTINHESLRQVVPPDDGPEMLLQARAYWTVPPGHDFYPTVIGSLRFIEFGLAILTDSRVRAKVAERNIEVSLAIYSPHPKTISEMMPAISKMMPAGMRFACLADYGARDIAANLPAWKPLARAKQRISVISWLEFDGLLAVGQDWTESLCENVHRAMDLGAETMVFNHWRVRALEANAAAAAALCWDSSQSVEQFCADYYTRLYGKDAVMPAKSAHHALEQATLYAKQNNYNVGFAADWVIRVSSNAPGYPWQRLAASRENYRRARDAFARLEEIATGAGKRQARYLKDICDMSVAHIDSVSHLQNAKLPLVGYKAWPLGNEHACWPPPERLADLAAEAKKAAELSQQYMRIYAQWVSSCDEQGHLAAHQQGVVEPFTQFAEGLEKQLKIETERQKALGGA